MEEQLEWKKREARKSALAENLDILLNQVIIAQIQEINGKLESLCQMGVLKDDEKMKDLQAKLEDLKKTSRG